MMKGLAIRRALFAGALLVLGVVAGYQVRERLRDRYVAYVLAAPDRAEAFRIANETMPDFEARSRSSAKIGDRYPIIYRASVAPSAAAALRKFLAQPSNYPPSASRDEEHTCVPQPGVGVRFWRGNDKVDAVFCFDCCTVWLYPSGYGYFCSKQPELTAIMHEIFPREQYFDLPHYSESTAVR